MLSSIFSCVNLAVTPCFLGLFKELKKKNALSIGYFSIYNS